jgi:mannose/fructose/N-acetylgalactosamine-specific phosphotransferase system component IIC
MSAYTILEITLIGIAILGLVYSHVCYNMALQSANLGQIELTNKEKLTQTSTSESALDLQC